MDPVTHVLSAAICTEPAVLAPGREHNRLRLRLAAALGALAPDADGVLGWIDLDLYSRYHRVFTHSLPGLLAITLLCAALARWLPRRALLPSLRRLDEAARPPLPTLLLFAAAGIALHFAGDWISAWGLWPLWPFSRADLALARVNSIEPALLAITVAAWAAQHALLVRGHPRAARATVAAWLAAVAFWVLVRPSLLGPPFI